MSYSDLYFKQKTQPSKILVGIALMVVVSFGIFYFSSDAQPTRASKQVIKQQKVVNVSSRQVGIFWESEVPDDGWVAYGTSPGNTNLIALDERDIQTTKEKRKYHYAILKNLSSDTDYFYQIVSNNEFVATPDSKPYTVHTPATSTTTGLLSPAYGKVALSSGSAAARVFVLMNIDKAYPLLALSGNTGEWLIPLQNVVSSNDQSYMTITESTISSITLFDDTHTSVVQAKIEQTHPVPQTTVLGQNYTFIEGSNVLSESTQRQAAGSQNRTFEVALRFPRNGSVIPGTAPLIRGYGFPGKTVTVVIDAIPTFNESVMVDKKGDWHIDVKRTFLPGKYNLTMTTENDKRRIMQIKSTYTLIKSGEQVLGDAIISTPSATLSPSPTSLTPTISSGIPSVIPTQPVLSGYPTSTPPPPISGINNIVPYAMTGAGLIMVGVGMFLLF